MKPILGTDQFSLNGIPSDMDAMHEAFPFGWYQISNGMEVGIMTRLAWPVFAKFYGGYHFFNPNPNGNWIFQSWDIYAESCARTFLDSMKGNFGATAPMIDVEARISMNYMRILFPTLSESQQIQKGKEFYFRMLKIICDIVETETGQIPVLYTGDSFWRELGGPSQTWASRLPLMVAVYPYDNFQKEAEYLAAIKKIMDGSGSLPPVKVPGPWTAATYVQFTGRAPAELIPGYAKEANWAKTVDMSILVGKEAATATTTDRNTDRTPVPAPTATNPVDVPGVAKGTGQASDSAKGVPLESQAGELFQCNRMVNVHAENKQASPFLGTLTKGTIVNIDETKGTYSHFSPMELFPEGGWIFTAFLQKMAG